MYTDERLLIRREDRSSLPLYGSSNSLSTPGPYYPPNSAKNKANVDTFAGQDQDVLGGHPFDAGILPRHHE